MISVRLTALALMTTRAPKPAQDARAAAPGLPTRVWRHLTGAAKR